MQVETHSTHRRRLAVAFPNSKITILTQLFKGVALSIAHHAARRRSAWLSILPALLLSSLAPSALADDAATATVATMSAPVAAKTAWQETRHGTVVMVVYFFLQKKSDPAVNDYLNAENAYTAAATAPIQPLADKLTAEIKGRML